MIEACDKIAASAQTEIAQALDDRAQEITDFASKIPPSDQFKVVQLGPTFALEPLSVSKPTPGIYVYNKSWDAIDQMYQKVKGTPIDENWIALNGAARGIVTDDQKRFSGANVYLQYDSGPMVLAIQKIVHDCETNAACLLPPLDDAQKQFLGMNPYYDWYWAQLRQGTSKPADLRTIVGKFDKRMTSDAVRYGFRHNSTVIRLGAHELQVPLDATPFSGAEAQMAGYIESIWKSDGLKVTVKWTTQSALPDVFRILLGDVPDERSFVSWPDRIMQLFPRVESRAIAHETGHVLGFLDHYYTIWHPENCRYEIQSRKDDIMSNHQSGQVLDEEWSDLDQQYPWTGDGPATPIAPTTYALSASR